MIYYSLDFIKGYDNVLLIRAGFAPGNCKKKVEVKTSISTCLYFFQLVKTQKKILLMIVKAL